MVPFLGRATELDELAPWCTEPDAPLLQLVVGADGAGKTRLANRALPADAAAGWLTGFRAEWAKASAIDRLRDLQEPSLLVLDYAETRCSERLGALEIFRSEPALDRRIALWGISRGAIAVSQLVERGLPVNVAILQCSASPTPGSLCRQAGDGPEGSRDPVGATSSMRLAMTDDPSMVDPRFRFVADLGEQLGTLHPGRAAIGPDGQLWLLARHSPPARWPPASNEDRAYWFQPHELVVMSFWEDVMTSQMKVLAPQSMGLVQPLGEGEVLLARNRCRRGEANAWVVNRTGMPVRTFTLGDGIADLQTSAAGDIWVSYFDEGVFGGVWDDGSGGRYERSGLIRATGAGSVTWRYSPPADADPVADCYALNVPDDSSAVWTCYHTSFALVRIDPNGRSRAWRSKYKGILAVAALGEEVLLAGGYAPETDRILLGRLGSHDELVDLRRLESAVPTPGPGGVLVGRGPVLHHIDGQRWHRMDIRDR